MPGTSGACERPGSFPPQSRCNRMEPKRQNCLRSLVSPNGRGRRRCSADLMLRPVCRQRMPFDHGQRSCPLIYGESTFCARIPAHLLRRLIGDDSQDGCPDQDRHSRSLIRWISFCAAVWRKSSILSTLPPADSSVKRGADVGRTQLHSTLAVKFRRFAIIDRMRRRARCSDSCPAPNFLKSVCKVVS